MNHGLHAKNFLTSHSFFLFQKSFKRKICYDWTRYTHMYLRLRGDGRTYQLNVQPDMYFDYMWNDLYNVPIYTRGGPYWQICKVRFQSLHCVYRSFVKWTCYVITIVKGVDFVVTSYHYINIPMPYTAIFHGCKNDNFQLIFFYYMYFHIFALKHRLWVHII